MGKQSTSALPHKKHKFLLFISGMSVKSMRAIENLQKVCDAHFKDDFDLEIIDITKDKAMAVTNQIIALPTLIKLQPDPKRIIVGDLSDTSKVLKILDVIN